MPKQKNRVVIDTNLWISFLLTNSFSKLDAVISGSQVTLLFSEELIEEFIEVVQRSKFKKYFTPGDIENLLLKIRTQALFIEVKSEITVCRDAKDNFLLSLAVDGKATHLITGDKDLLVLGDFAEIKILTISEYLSNF